MKKVVIFILGYRAISYLKSGSLVSIIKASKKIKDASTKIIFLDNYSCDGSVQYVLKNHKNIDVLLSPKNYMYCRGTNIGIQYSYKRYKPDYFILVDADNRCDENAYDELVKFANINNDVGIVQPIVRGREDNKTLYSCGHAYVDDVFCRPLREIPTEKALLNNLPSCSISSTLIKTEVFKKCGLLDPIFDIYYESSDISFRARSVGYRCACHVRAITYNEGAKISEIDNYHESYFRHRNGLIFWKKHDEKKFNKLRDLQLDIYSKLQDELKNSEFGLGVIKESARKGIEDGLKITSSCDLSKINTINIKEYDKTEAILLQTGI